MEKFRDNLPDKNNPWFVVPDAPKKVEFIQVSRFLFKIIIEIFTVEHNKTVHVVKSSEIYENYMSRYERRQSHPKVDLDLIMKRRATDVAVMRLERPACKVS